MAFSISAEAKVNVWTHHYDNLRTGWNRFEQVLTPARVAGGSFKRIAAVAVDDQVDAQPLLVTGELINGRRRHDVVYVATESDTVYGIDAHSGQILLQVSLGQPVPATLLPGRCNNNGPNIGINSTPVIDLSAHTMYVVTYTLEGGSKVFRLHALNLETLTDKVPSVVIAPTATLADRTSYNFDPDVHRQRSALLLANGNIYAAFASFCDVYANQSRGWVLGWRASTLALLPNNRLSNTRTTAPNNFFLSSVWMSGNGIAADTAGNLYFATGNSDKSGTTYSTQQNLSESIIEMSPDLSTVYSYFTPSNVDGLDENDGDFTAGGVMLLPPQGGLGFGLAVAAGKFGTLYLLNANMLSNGLPWGWTQYLGAFPIGGCWCGESYFMGADGYGRIITSGGRNVGIWRVQTQPNVTLIHEHQTSNIANAQDPGFFTSVSSNGRLRNTAIVWAVGRPIDNDPAYVNLYAFDPHFGNLLYSAVAGSWPNIGANANIVPVVANGNVYVAADQSLAIFGLSTSAPAKLPKIRISDTRAPLVEGEHEIYGLMQSIRGDNMTVRLRNGDLLTIDASLADELLQRATSSVGHAVLARGTFDGAGVLHANTILRAKDNSALWWPDR
jgi:hypothetical protein